MKKVMALLAVSFVLVSANYAQTGTRSTDTTGTPHKTMKKNMHRGTGKMDSATRSNGSLYPLNSGTGRADSSNSGNSTIIPNQNPGQTQNPTPLPTNPNTTPTNPSPVPNQSPVPNPTPTNPNPTSPTTVPHK